MSESSKAGTPYLEHQLLTQLHNLIRKLVMRKLKHVTHTLLDGMYECAFDELRKSMDLLCPRYYPHFSVFVLKFASNPNASR